MLLSWFLEVYTWILIARVLMSWFNPSPNNPLVQFVLRLTEPVLAPIRKVIPAMGGLDLSPIVVFIALMFLKRLIQ
jgi:YggT family protein